MIAVPRFFVPEELDENSGLKWTLREVQGFPPIEAPAEWSDLAVSIAAQKYFRKNQEFSVRQMVDRVVDTLQEFASTRSIFASSEDLKTWGLELKYLLLHQMAAFNSPVWFNLGHYQKYGVRGHGGGHFRYDERSQKVIEIEDPYEFPQVSACFIQSVEDDLLSLFELVKTEAKLFKYGSGTGTNFSKVRARGEPLANGGTSSGLMPFLEVLDKGAGAIKSGGTTRRAAKMVCLDMDHPEIREFILWKKKEEEKARILIEAGFSAHFEGEAYRTVSGQNSNNSVRVSDEFMKALAEGKTWKTLDRLTGKPREEFKAADLWRDICEAAWYSADPGIQFSSTIDHYHVCPNSGPIRASNPCSEYMFVDDSACNLASLNLLKFLNRDGTFNTSAFVQAARTVLIAQDLLVDMASYPTAKIAENSFRFRPLGLGYANLGAFLMQKGLAYDSKPAREWCAAVTALLHGQAALTSIELAKALKPFPEFERNRKPFLDLLTSQGRHAKQLQTVDSSLKATLDNIWDLVLEEGPRFGYRNAQLTLLAPTGTIGLLMDCDTTGIEPEFALVKHKKFAGSCEIDMVSRSVRPALERLGYSTAQIKTIELHVAKTGGIRGAPGLSQDHEKVFACAGDPDNPIAPDGHLLMMQSAQSFLSGAISKTINLPKSATPEDIGRIFQRAWELKLKAIAIYRDGSKATQPLNAGSKEMPKCSRCGQPTLRLGGCFQCTSCGHAESCSF